MAHASVIRREVRWTETEWESVAEFAYAEMQRNPALSLLTLAKQAQQRFTEGRRRTLSSAQTIEPLTRLIAERLRVAATAAAVCPDMAKRLRELEAGAPTREQLLATITTDEAKILKPTLLTHLTAEEAYDYFDPVALIRHVPLGRLAGIAAERFADTFLEAASKPAQLPDHVMQMIEQFYRPLVSARLRESMPAVGIFGIYPAESDRIIRELRPVCNPHIVFNHVDKLPDDLPTFDLVFAWTKGCRTSLLSSLRKRYQVDLHAMNLSLDNLISRARRLSSAMGNKP